MGTMTVRELPDDLQAFLKADAVANKRSVNKQVIVALQAYRDATLAKAPRLTTPEEKTTAIRLIQDKIARVIKHDPRTDNEIIGYNDQGCFD